MKALVPPRLERLLAAYEHLTRDESAALHGRDFATLERIHALKPALLDEVIALGTQLGLDRRNPWLHERLTTLAALEKENEDFATRALSEWRVENENFHAARKRLRGLGHAYGGEEVAGRRLVAQG